MIPTRRAGRAAKPRAFGAAAGSILAATAMFATAWGAGLMPTPGRGGDAVVVAAGPGARIGDGATAQRLVDEEAEALFAFLAGLDQEETIGTRPSVGADSPADPTVGPTTATTTTRPSKTAITGPVDPVTTTTTGPSPTAPTTPTTPTTTPGTQTTPTTTPGTPTTSLPAGPGTPTTLAPPPTTTPPAPTTTAPTGFVFPAQSFFVDKRHPNTSNRNAGTSEDAPWRTIVHAAANAQPGDTIFVKKGTYDDGRVDIEHSGTPGNPIVFRTYPGDERKVTVRGEGFWSIGNSYLEIRDFFITETERHGIRVEGPEDPYAPPATDIVISGNHTYDTCSSGVSVWGVQWGEDPGDYDNIRNVDIEYNLLELGTNGCKGEIITVAGGAVDVDVRYNTIRIGDPTFKDGDEGIDFKEGVRDSRIYGNEIYDLSDKAIYIDGGSGEWDPLVSNIQIFNNHMYDLPSHGISIVTEGRGDVDGIYVFNNIVHDVQGDGFVVYDHPGGEDDGGTVKNVVFYNNTVWNAGLAGPGYGGYRVNHERATGIVFRNNIAWGNTSYDIRGEDETTIEYNLCRESHCEVRTDPGFANPGSDFRLTAGSPAIDAGTSFYAPEVDRTGVARPQHAAHDLGAYEFR